MPPEGRSRIAGIAAYATMLSVLVGGGTILWAGSRPGIERIGAVDAGSVRPAPKPVPQAAPAEAAPPRSTALDLFRPEPTASTSFQGSIVLHPPYEVINATTFQSGETRIRLAYVDGVRRSDVCIDPNQLKFACGLMGRASLANLLRSNPVVCHRTFLPDSRESIAATCLLGDTDLAEHQIRAGMARPESTASERYVAATAEARASGAGAWTGGWTLLPLSDDRRNGIVPPAPAGPTAAPDQAWANSQ